MADKDYLTTSQAAEILGVAVSTIQQWANEGLLKAWTTSGGHRRIVRSSIDEMLSQRMEAQGKTSQQQFSVVVVEDNAQQIRMYEKQFRRWDKHINVVTAQDGYEGLIKIGQTTPSIIITDLKMPNMNGFQMIKAIKEMPELSSCTIIVVTGLSDEEIEEYGDLPEYVELYIKPISFDKLESIFREKIMEFAA